MTPKPRSAAPRSVAEQTLAVQLEQAGIPFEREVVFAKPRKYRADFAVWADPLSKKYDIEADILIEVDGGTWVSGRHNRGSSIAKDFEKGALAAINGYRVIHCTTDQVNDGTCLSWIKAALGLEERAA